MKKEKPHRQGRFGFWLMTQEFRIRDRIHPPQSILRRAGITSGMNVLDFGCGPGEFSAAAARIVGPEGRIVAMDISPFALATVGRVLKRKGIANVFPMHGDGMGALPDRNFDAVLAYDVLHDIGDQAPFLKEMHRVLKTGGVLSVSDHHLKEAVVDRITAGDLFRFRGRAGSTFQFEPVKESR